MTPMTFLPPWTWVPFVALLGQPFAPPGSPGSPPLARPGMPSVRSWGGLPPQALAGPARGAPVADRDTGDTTGLPTQLPPVLLTPALVQHYFAVQHALLDWLNARQRAHGELPMLTVTYTAPRANGTDTVRLYRPVLDVAALAAQDTAVAALFRAQQLAPTQYLPVNQSIRNAQHAAWDVQAGVPLAQPAGIAGQNVRYVLAHCRDFEGRQEAGPLTPFPWKCAWLAKLGVPPVTRPPVEPVLPADWQGDTLPNGAPRHPRRWDTLPAPPLLPLTAAGIERYVEVLNAIGAFSVSFERAKLASAMVYVRDPDNEFIRMNRWVDGTRLAAQDPVAEAIFAAHQLPPAQFLPLVLTLLKTEVDLNHFLVTDSVNDLDPASVAGKNFAVVREHCQHDVGVEDARGWPWGYVGYVAFCNRVKVIKERTK